MNIRITDGWMWEGRILSDLVCQMPGWEGKWLTRGAEGWVNNGMNEWVSGWMDGWRGGRESSVTVCGRGLGGWEAGSWASY